MGFNTTILILNDGWDQIVAHPDEFIEKVGAVVSSGIHRRVPGFEGDDFGVSIGIGNHCNNVQVMCNDHADITNVLLVGGNYGTVVGKAHTYRHHEKDYIKNALNQALSKHGLKVIEASKKG